MENNPIKTNVDYQAALKKIERLWESQPGTSAGDKLDVLATLVDAYEEEHFPIPAFPGSPIDAIKFRMDQMGLKPKDLQPYMGGSGRVSEILNGRRSLSLRMIRRLHKELDIPLEILIQEPSANSQKEVEISHI